MSRRISVQRTRRVHELARGTQAKHSFDYGVCMCTHAHRLACTFGCTLSTPYIVEYPIVRHRHRRLAPPEELADRKEQLDLKLRLLAMDVETQVPPTNPP